MTFDTSPPAMPAFALALVALFTKTTLTSALQVASRLRAGVFPIPEDARLMRKPPADAEADFVRRCANVWRNDTENLPLFTTNPDDFKGLDDLLTVVAVTRPRALHDR